MSRQFRGRVAMAAALMGAIVGCGDSGKPAAPPAKAPTAAPVVPAGSPVAAVQAPPSEPKEALLAEVRKRQLSNEDFVESENNRDPFRSYLATFAVQTVVNRRQHKIILEKFSLDELKLIAIVSGEGETAKAMFVDPGGLGVTVRRGDHMTKADATITRIAPDRVFFQMEEEDGGKVKTSERVIELHASEAVTQ